MILSSVFRLLVSSLACAAVADTAVADLALPPDELGAVEVVYSDEDRHGVFEIHFGPIVRRSRPVAMTSHFMRDVRAYVGHSTRQHIKIAGTISTAELHAFYTTQLATNGYRVLLDSPGDTPMAPGGTSWALRAYGGLPTEIATELSGTFDKAKRRYIVAERTAGAQHVIVAILINLRRADEVRIQLDRIVVDTPATRALTPTAEQIRAALDDDGTMHVAGIRFQGKKAIPLDSSVRVLAEVARMLADDAELRLKLSARSSVSGATDADDMLARARVRAVIDLLVYEHDVRADRIAIAEHDVPVSTGTAGIELIVVEK